MENKFRNELEIVIGGEKILLRPTFENIASMEANVGSVAYLAWCYSRGLSGGKEAMKNMPSMSDSAKIIYFNQAATRSDDSTQKKLSLEEIWDLVMSEGVGVARVVVQFLAKVTAGNKVVEIEELAPVEKKN